MKTWRRRSLLNSVCTVSNSPEQWYTESSPRSVYQLYDPEAPAEKHRGSPETPPESSRMSEQNEESSKMSPKNEVFGGESSLHIDDLMEGSLELCENRQHGVLFCRHCGEPCGLDDFLAHESICFKTVVYTPFNSKVDDLEFDGRRGYDHHREDEPVVGHSSTFQASIVQERVELNHARIQEREQWKQERELERGQLRVTCAPDFNPNPNPNPNPYRRPVEGNM